MGSFSLTHLLLIAVIFLLFFGPSKLPSLGSSLGKAIRGFKEGLNGEDPETKASQRNVGPDERLSSSSQQANSQMHQTEKKKETQDS